METNVKSFLEKIQEINDEKIEVSVLSTGKSLKCNPLSFKQQKELISTIADGVLGNLKFQKILNQIVIDNTEDRSLTILDKILIVLKLRKNSIGNEVTINENTIKLDEFLSNSSKISKFKDTDVVEYSNLKVSLRIPLLTSDIQITQATIDSIKKDGDELSKNIGNIYTYEIVKYIESLEMGEDKLTFSDLKVSDRVKIVDNLPIALNKLIVEFIQNTKKIEKDLLTVEVAGESHTLDIDVNFFDS